MSFFRPGMLKMRSAFWRNVAAGASKPNIESKNVTRASLFTTPATARAKSGAEVWLPEPE